MKAERKEEAKFVPVIITLESQDEVDEPYAILNTNPITGAGHLSQARHSLRPFIVSDKLHDELSKRLRLYYGK